MKYILLVSASLAFLLSCNSKANSQNQISVEKKDSIIYSEEVKIPEYIEFDRTKIREQLQAKIDSGIPLVAHVLVPLCDNNNQGIVPTTASLGNGLSLRSNLYWVTSNGMKRYFKQKSDWKMLKDIIYDKDSTILERVVFKKNFKNGTEVILITDAYRGDRMEECLIPIIY